MKPFFQIAVSTAIGLILVWLLYKFAEFFLANWWWFAVIVAALLVVSVVGVRNSRT